MGFFRLQKMEDKVWSLERDVSIKQINTQFLLHSEVDKKSEIKNIIDQLDFKYHSNFIIFGLKNLELLKEIYKRKTPFSTMMVIEITEGDFVQLEAEDDELDFLSDKNVNLILGNGDYLLTQLKGALANSLGFYNLQNMKIISMPYIKSSYSKEVQEITKVIIDSLSTKISSYGNDVQDILMGMDNYINNWQHTFRGIDHKFFKDSYLDKPAVIVGAGPSIEKSVKYIKALKGKALILSVDAAMDVLLDEGIVPDIIASIERTKATVTLYQRETIPQEIVYVGANQVPKAILDRMSRIVFTGRVGDSFFREFNSSIGLSNMNIGNNVSHILISFAEFLGCNTVIFTGLDLAYPQGVTHAKRTLDNFTDKMKAVYKNDVVYVKGQKGEMLETQEYFMHTRVWIEDFILNNKKCTYINSSEGGANINGAINMNISKAIEKYCSDTRVALFVDTYDKIIGNYSIDKIATTGKAIEFFNNLIEFFNNIHKIAEENYDLLYNEKETGILALMEEQRFSLGKLWPQNPAANFIMQSLTIKYTRDIHSFPMYLEKEDEVRMKKVNMDHYDLLKKVTQRVNKDLNLYIETLKSYLHAFEKEGINE